MVVNDFPTIFSKGWFKCVLVCLGILGFMIILALIFGDKVGIIIGYIGFGGFCFMMGVQFGIGRAKTMHRETEKQRWIEEEYKRTHSD